MRKKSPIKALKKELDDLWGMLVRAQWNYICVRCGREFSKTDPQLKQKLHPHHIFSRRHESTKWNPGNGIALCYRCHFYWVKSSELKDKQEYIDLLNHLIGESRLEMLRQASQRPSKFSLMDLEAIKEKLAADLRLLESCKLADEVL